MAPLTAEQLAEAIEELLDQEPVEVMVHDPRSFQRWTLPPDSPLKECYAQPALQLLYFPCPETEVREMLPIIFHGNDNILSAEVTTTAPVIYRDQEWTRCSYVTY